MPDPRPLGYAARSVVAVAADALEANSAKFFDVAADILCGENLAAVAALREIAERNSTTLRALILLLADRHADAQDVLMSAKLRKNREVKP
jgi:hypothetical protein